MWTPAGVTPAPGSSGEGIDGCQAQPPAGDPLTSPHESAGGKSQHVLIAGRLVVQPSLLIADEPASMLAASHRAKSLNLLGSLRKHPSLPTLRMAFDPATAAHFTDQTAAMCLGESSSRCRPARCSSHQGAPMPSRGCR
jgi:peptide/nickel transport system ATP-binding protein